MRTSLIPLLVRCALIAAGLTTSPVLSGSPRAADARPNIILIVADDLGYGDLGCFGSEKIRTPNLDRLAREGTRFTDFYAGAPVCAPSRGVLLTGLHSGHGRIRNNSPQVGGELESFADGKEGGMRLSFTASDHTFAEDLQRAGYATGATGKWGVGEPGSDGTPGKHGFDEWLGYLNQNHAPYYYTDYLWKNDRQMPIPANAGGKRAVYSNDLMADFSLDFVRRHQAGPFFLYLAYTIPHNRMEVPELGDYAKESWPDEAKTYAAMVTRLDSYVGRLLAELDRLGLAENTLLLFTSDNGALAGKRCDLFKSNRDFRGAKGAVYEGGLRVPMIVRWPGHVAAGRTSAEPWMFVDFFPTFTALARVAPPANLDGRNVLPVLTGGKESLGDRPLYWEIPEDRLWQAVRVGRWKAVRRGLDQPVELYDLTTDSREQHNVAAEHADVAARLVRLLDTAHTPSPHWPVN